MNVFSMTDSIANGIVCLTHVTMSVSEMAELDKGYAFFWLWCIEKDWKCYMG